MTAELAVILAPGALVLLHSAEAARHFARECARVAIDRAIIALAVLAPAIAAAAGEGWAALRMAEFPTDPALLASAADLWHMPATMRGSAKAT
jgi:uroporphyrinogen-III synthase